MNQKVFLTLIFNILFTYIYSQNLNIGILPVRNYEKKEYGASTQNWDIEQDANGVVYFANNTGLLQFDGTHWKTYPISNRTIIRSLCISKDGKIYVGGQGEFGYFLPSNSGTLEYHSYSHLVPEKHKGFTDIWHIEETEYGVFFKSGEAVFKIYGGILEVHTFEGNISFLGRFGQDIFVQINNQSLWIYENSSFLPWQNLDDLSSPITSVLEIEESYYMTSLKNGFYKLENGKWSPLTTKYDSNFFEKFVFYSATSLPNGKIAIGSPPNGLLLFDSNWNLEYIANREKGLQNNGVLSVHVDNKENLWLGLDNGIDYLEANSPITIIYPDGGLEGTGYAASIHNNNIYLGTTNGLFVKPWVGNEDPLNPKLFEFIKGTDAQNWGLNSVNGSLFLGHHEGAFEINGNQARPLNNGIGTWLFKKLNETQIIVGQYNGLSLLELKNGTWQFSKHLDGLDESSRILVKDENDFFWMAHPYRGIFKVNPNPETGRAIFQFYDSEKGLPSNQFNHVFKIKNKAIFTGEFGVYEFDSETDRFIEYSPLANFFEKSARVKSLTEDKFGNIWFSVDHDVGVLKVNDSGLERNIEKIIFPELSNKLVGGFDFIYPYDQNNVFFACEKGFILLDPSKYAQIDTTINVLLSEVRIYPNDSLLYIGTHEPNRDSKTFELERSQNNLIFKFSAPIFQSEKSVMYQTKIEGLDEEWLAWSPKTEREINNLSPGDYVFKLRAKNGYNTKSETKSFHFSIAPPWYATKTSFTIFGFSFVGVLFGILFLQKNKFENEKAELESVHQKKEEEHKQVVQKTEAMINQLETENLEAKIKHNHKELALATMHLVQKNQMIARIQRELSKISMNKELNSTTKSELRKLNNLLTQDQALDEDWNQFEIHFDQVHSNFLKKLRENYSQLSPNDYRLCAYLRMNLSTKEIAPLLNISVRGVEASRYRLRKKLDLPNEQNLNEFMMNI